jgi:N-carbamoyl-L-amino-acid hydrolase
MDDRQDPMLGLAQAILDVHQMAVSRGILGTVGKVSVSPGAVNAIPGTASLWIDARGSEEIMVLQAMAEFGRNALRESWTPSTSFSAPLLEAISRAIGRDLPLLPSGAGHDAGVLALAGIPTAMILVRNPSGISHAPEEYAEDDDCESGVLALAAVIRDRSA